MKKGGQKTAVKKKVMKKKGGQKTKTMKPTMMRDGMKTKKKMGRGKSTDMGKGIENFQNMVTRLYGGGKTK